jgi:hypothetical protein
MRWHDRDKLPRALFRGHELEGHARSASVAFRPMAARSAIKSHRRALDMQRANLTAGASRVRRAELSGRDPGQGQRRTLTPLAKARERERAEWHVARASRTVCVGRVWTCGRQVDLLAHRPKMDDSMREGGGWTRFDSTHGSKWQILRR